LNVEGTTGDGADPHGGEQPHGSSIPLRETSSAPPAWPRRRELIRLALVFAAAFAACLVIYLVLAVPASWFPSAATLAWGARDVEITRGSGRVVDDEVIVTSSDATGMTLVSVATDFRSTDYPAIAWIAIDLPEGADAYLLWQTDYATNRINSVPLRVESGRLLPASMLEEPPWIGRVKGVALAIKGQLPQPVRIRGVIAKPMGAAEVLGDRAAEWFAFEGWTGASINTVTGGADIQGLPLPLLLAASIALTLLVVLVAQRVRPGRLGTSAAAALVVCFVAAWLALDLRWMWNLARQAEVTAERYAGKSWRDKRLANEDGPLFDFAQKALDVLPKSPARIFVVADAHYFRGRAAYHLYPHSVFFDPRSNVMPSSADLRPGDWLLVFRRKGVQYDAKQQRLRWDDNQFASAELKLVGPGAGLFLIR
jgi:hypothetical protein